MRPGPFLVACLAIATSLAAAALQLTIGAISG